MDFLRAKQAGVSHDYSGTLANAPDVFILDEVVKYGFNSTISALSYDPIQSLLAVGTHEHGEVSGEVHIFGQKRVHVKFTLSRKASVRTIRLCDTRLIVLDSKNELTLFNIEKPLEKPVRYSPPGIVTVLECDSCLDWCFLGLQNGEVVAYDIDREVLAPFRIPNYWRDHRNPKARLLPVQSLQLHPKDVGTLLIGYLEGAVVYSFKQNAPLHFLSFELKPGAPGADTEPSQIRQVRRSRLSQALWHPTGTFICTTYEDGVMVFWNPKDGQIVQARTLQEANVHLPTGAFKSEMYAAEAGASVSVDIRQPIFKISWCSGSNPDDTSLLIAGGDSINNSIKGLTLLDFGPTPNTITSSVQVLADHLAVPRQRRFLRTNTPLDVIDFCLVPKISPHWGGSHEPVAVIGLQASGELMTLRFPDGAPISPAAVLHPTLMLSHPFPTRIDTSMVNRNRWLGMEQHGNKPTEILIGGIERKRPMRRYETRTIGLSCHPNGTVRIFDLGHDDEIENQGILELDVGRVVQRGVGIAIKCVSMAGATAETAVALETGEVVVYRWGRNPLFGKTQDDEAATAQSKTVGQISEGLVDVKLRADPDLKEGLLPFFLLDQKCGPVAALKMSDVGFLAVAYESGDVAVVDLRGPAIIFNQSLSALTKAEKRASLRPIRRDSTIIRPDERATCVEFGVMTLDEDAFSSLSLFIGTSAGHVVTYKILPNPSGTYGVQIAGTHSVDDAVVSLTPLNSETGQRAWATPQAFASLRNGVKTPGILSVTTRSGTHLYRPPGARGAHRSFDKPLQCYAASVVELEEYGVCLCAILNSSLKAYTLPGLKSIPVELNLSRLSTPITILESGHILGWSGEHELELVYIFGKGVRLDDPSIPPDLLYNPETPPPPRPTISNLQWLSGTQYISTADLDLLIGGPDRPVSVKQQMQLRQEAAAAKKAEREGAHAPPRADTGAGVWANMTKTLQERTEQLSFAGDSMDKLGESSAQFADDVGKFVKKQQRDMLFKGVMGKFF